MEESKTLNDKAYKFTSNDGVSVVNFYVEWNFYSKIQKLILNKFHQITGNKTKIYYVNCDKNKSLTEKLNIVSYPTILIYKNGKMVSHLSGLQNNETLVKQVGKFL
jgi:thioredoxin 1